MLNALIIGCGRVGSSIALELQAEGWGVTVVDENEDALTRLGESWPGSFIVGHGMDADLLRDRLIKEAVHEVGHTLDLTHCDDYACAMAASHAVEWIDLKEASLCPNCQGRVLEAAR